MHKCIDCNDIMSSNCLAALLFACRNIMIQVHAPVCGGAPVITCCLQPSRPIFVSKYFAPHSIACVCFCAGYLLASQLTLACCLANVTHCILNCLSIHSLDCGTARSWSVSSLHVEANRYFCSEVLCTKKYMVRNMSKKLSILMCLCNESAVQKEGLVVKDVVVLIDREQGGAARMASNGLKLYSAFTLSFILEVLVKNGLVDDQVAASVKSFIAANQTFNQSDAATKASADAPAADAGASTTAVEAATAAKAAAEAACAAPMPRTHPYKRSVGLVQSIADAVYLSCTALLLLHLFMFWLPSFWLELRLSKAVCSINRCCVACNAQKTAMA